MQQYQQDVIRIEAHKLALKDDEFQRVSELVRREVREHARYLREERGAPIVLHDRDWQRITVENTDGLRVAAFVFNTIRHEIDVRGIDSHYVFEVAINHDGKPVVVGRKFGQSLGTVDVGIVINAVRNAVESITDLPRPIV